MNIVNVVINPAACLGTRLRPDTDYFSKEILQIRSKPMIQYALEEAWEGGIQKALIIVCMKRYKNILSRTSYRTWRRYSLL